MATATVTDPGVPNEPTMEEILADFPPGPLDIYRKKASFDWKKMKHYLEGEDMIKFKVGYFAVNITKSKFSFIIQFLKYH